MTDAPGALGGGDVLVVPPALLAGFGEHAGRAPSLEELRGLGYDEVVSVHRYEDDAAARGHRPRRHRRRPGAARSRRSARPS